MPIIIHCPHDETELVLKKDNKGPEGLLECPKCHCIFRVSLANFDMNCYIKQYPKLIGAEPKESKKVEWFGGPITEIPEKRKRGRPKKID